MSVADYNVGIISIASPLFNAEGEVLGSLALVASNKLISADRFKDFAPVVVENAREVSQRIAMNQSVVALPARAIG